MMKVSYGIDLAGLSTGKTSIARAELGEGGGPLTVRILPSVLNEEHALHSRLDAVRDQLHEEVQSWEENAVVCVDAPLDLQDLPLGDGVVPQFIWQLTRRPIDYVLGALPPLADKIGSPVLAWRAISPFNIDDLGEKVFETYPAASLEMSQFPSTGYKPARVRFQRESWAASGKDPKGKSQRLCQILTTLGVIGFEGAEISDDDFDAVLCAITGLEGDSLLEETVLRDRLLAIATTRQCVLPETWALPSGYRLIDLAKTLWKTVRLEAS